MGLGDADLLDDGDGGGGGGKASAAAVPCSICLDVVTDAGDRSWAKLQCGHQFHLDCIGSAFNIKGAMQCPNCRKIEKGQWLYANGGRQLPEFSMDDLAHDEDLYDLSYSEMSFGVHWCPFSGLTRLPSSFDEGEFPSSAYHDLLGHHAIFAEHTPVSSTSHPCPYIAYFGPIHPSSSTSSGNVSDGSSFSNHWSGLSAPSEVPNSYAFPSMDAHYHNNWDHSSHFAASNRIGSADLPPIPSVTQRTARNSDIPRPGMHPFIVGHSSASRAPSSITSSVLPPYPGPVARPRDRPPPVQAYFQQSSSAPVARASLVSSGRRSGSHRGLPQVASSSDHSGGFYFFSSNPSGRSFQDAERDHFHGWERDHREQQAGFPLNQVDRDSIWAPFHHPSAGGSDPGVRPSNFRQRHGSERMPSQNRT
ncbi:E3 ubiquitin-protein ligase IPI1-like isoform X2 [Salvia miltiorrhiza]|uniref:E3 ubiquitin-protein ligase IPI1-like isoform X2 n=1 Tax=Salvia miltiorrhiza TaxID=226208 RepID=UPI0025AD26B6|nr:E3 ubiquitin-protein ligase IPI1-like isoform X2 [Salvia miltiorrhiza]